MKILRACLIGLWALLAGITTASVQSLWNVTDDRPGLVLAAGFLLGIAALIMAAVGWLIARLRRRT